ncbi:uncharacterized protein LOC105156746 [Sesamum indicum]|uniref:Uncharacterized protein LOC105156746 n=1 Tax=Sesamum indicum TaxID=4182 RepID=A0A8M8UUY5_SESIN|nr:uncharacterized protein LOC105156746 [Sesamum indicum]
MYVTRPLSQLLKSPESLARPPEHPNSGFLVIQDEEYEKYSCLGCSENTILKHYLPFPQDKELTVQYTTGSADIAVTPVFLIPVLNHPSSPNRYYLLSHVECAQREEDKAPAVSVTS